MPNPGNWAGGCVFWLVGGLGGEEAVEVVGANRWLDGIFGKLGLEWGQNLVWRSVETFETVHGKPFYTRAGIYPLAARWGNLAAEFCVSCCRVRTYTCVQWFLGAEAVSQESRRR